MKNFQCPNVVCMTFFFWLGMNSFFVATAGRNFFSDKFPLHDFFSWELPRNHLRTDLPTYLPTHLPPFLIKMNAARFFSESTNLLFPFYSSVT